MKSTTIKISIEENIYRVARRGLTVNLYNYLPTITDGTIFGTIAVRADGINSYSEEDDVVNGLYSFEKITKGKYSVIVSGPGVTGQLARGYEEIDVLPYNITGNDLAYDDNENTSIAKEINDLKLKSGQLLAMNFEGDQDKYYISPAVMTISNMYEFGDGTVDLYLSSDGTNFNQVYTPFDMTAGEILKLSCYDTGDLNCKTITLT